MKVSISIDFKPQEAVIVYNGTIELAGDITPFEIKSDKDKEIVFWPEDDYPNLNNDILEMFKNRIPTSTITTKHDYLERDDFYEYRTVNKGRSNKTCEHCGLDIPIGTPHLMMHFYPEFASYPVHRACEDEFMESLN